MKSRVLLIGLLGVLAGCSSTLPRAQTRASTPKATTAPVTPTALVASAPRPRVITIVMRAKPKPEPVGSLEGVHICDRHCLSAVDGEGAVCEESYDSLSELERHRPFVRARKPMDRGDKQDWRRYASNPKGNVAILQRLYAKNRDAAVGAVREVLTRSKSGGIDKEAITHAMAHVRHVSVRMRYHQPDENTARWFDEADELVPALLELLRREDVGWTAGTQLGYLGAESAVHPLIELLEDRQPAHVRSNAARALSVMNMTYPTVARSARAALEQALQARNVVLRIEAVRALQYICDEKSYAVLRKARKSDSSQALRREADEAMEYIEWVIGVRARYGPLGERR